VLQDSSSVKVLHLIVVEHKSCLGEALGESEVLCVQAITG
jgi:hypothetical protein